jgi:hypothetical protein
MKGQKIELIVFRFYGQQHHMKKAFIGESSRGYLVVNSQVDLDSLFQKIPELFTDTLNSTAHRGDHFEVTACVYIA